MNHPPKNFKDDSNAWAMRDEDDDGTHSAFLHNDPVFGFLDTNVNGNVNINGNENVNSVKNHSPYGVRPQQSMPPLHSNPYNGGYTPCYSFNTTYTAASLPVSLSHLSTAQQQSLLDMNVSHLSQQNSLNQAKNHNPNLNNHNNYSHLPNGTVAPPALSSNHYPSSQMSTIVRGISIDESGDHTDHSCSNESNNGDNIIDIPIQSYYYDPKEVCEY